MNRFAAVSIALVLAALGLAACDGDDAPTKAEFAGDADKICKDAKKRLGNVGKDATKPDEMAEAVDTVIEETRASVGELKELDLPEGEGRKAAERFVNALESEIEDDAIPAFDALREALAQGDQKAAQDAVERLRALRTDSARFARELGARACVG